MNIKYRIIEVDPTEHSIVVRYYSDQLPELELISVPGLKEDGTPIRCRTDVSLTLPIPEPTEEELKTLILMNCPVGFFETQEKIRNNKIKTSMPLSKRLLNVETLTNDTEILNSKKPKHIKEPTAEITDTMIKDVMDKIKL